MITLLVKLISGYQRISSYLFPPHCRFVPSCSEYAKQAILTHGLGRGLWLALKRIGRCNGYTAGGLDPIIPQKRSVN